MMMIAVESRNPTRGTFGRSIRFAVNWLSHAAASRAARRRLSAILRNACRVLGLKRGKGPGLLGLGNAAIGLVLATAMIAGLSAPAFAGPVTGGGTPQPPASVNGNGIFINNGSDPTCNHVADSASSTIPIVSILWENFVYALGLNIKAGTTTLDSACNPGANDSIVETDTVLDADVTRPDGNILYSKGQTIPAGTILRKNDKAEQSNKVLFYADGLWGNGGAGATSLSLGGELFVNTGRIGLGGATWDHSMAIGNPVAYDRDPATGRLLKADRYENDANGTSVKVQRYNLDPSTNTYRADDQGDYIKRHSDGFLGIGAGDYYEKDTNIQYRSHMGTVAGGMNAAAFGNDAKAFSSGSLALGYKAGAGDSRYSSQYSLDSLKLGHHDMMAIGTEATAFGTDTLALGHSAHAGNWSGNYYDHDMIAIGHNASALGTGAGIADAVALGHDALASASDTLALGHGATATIAQSVALGSLAKTRAAVAVDGSTAYGVVSVGDKGKERQIINVAAGQLNKDSTDAVIGKQLFSTNEDVKTLKTRVDATGPGLVQYDAAAKKLTVGKDKDATTVDFAQSEVKNAAGIVIQQAGTRKLTGLSDGDVSAVSSDAITGKQLFVTNSAVKSISDNIGTVDIQKLGQTVAGHDGDIRNLATTVNTTVNNFTSGRAGLVQQAPLPQPGPLDPDGNPRRMNQND
ncbi:MAG: hypothetical protein ACRECY_10140, partial [Phyllobacterium sp.]